MNLLHLLAQVKYSSPPSISAYALFIAQRLMAYWHVRIFCASYMLFDLFLSF